jgi:murein DD-endopeptidase MepM/ murein hydrolase activator NlpD
VTSAKSGLTLNGVGQLYNQAIYNRGYHPETGELVVASNYNAEVVIWNEDLQRSFTYLHFSQVNVTEGQMINPGDIIGIEGSTGYSTGRHAHLEVHHNGKIENSLDTLEIALSNGILDKIYRI